MAIIDDFKERFPPPEFATADVDLYFPRIEPYIGCYYGGDYVGCDVEIILNIIAHLMVREISASNGNSSPSYRVASKSVGSVSVSYVASSGIQGDYHDFYSTTVYGQRVLILTAKNVGGYFV